MYVATASPARDESASYVAWGHSTAVSPWGEVIAKTDEKESIVYVDIGNTSFHPFPSVSPFLSPTFSCSDLEYLQQVRAQVPITKQRRSDVYEIVQK